MSLKKPLDSGSYMDNVNVKIAEEYKPPPKINIPITHNQRLTFNKHIQDGFPNYDFSKERNILQRVKEWKSNRLINEEQRKIRLQNLKEKEEAEEPDCEEEETAEINVSPPTDASEIHVSSIGSSCTTSYSNGMLMPTKVINYYSNILQPIPLTANGPNSSSTGIKSPFNISEFEADTSSPFDNVALKSINDVEELAKVLKIEDDTCKSSYSNYHATSNLQTYPNYSSISNYPSSVSHGTQNSLIAMNGYYNSCDMNPMRSFTSGYECSPPTNNYLTAYKPNHNSLREKSLEGEKSGPILNYSGSKTKSSPEAVIIKNDVSTGRSIGLNNSIPNDPFDVLPKHLQEFSRNISSMGFPLSRVARTCKILGDDNKKVVDHLLAMSELLDLGFAEDKVSEALLQSDNDRDKALDKLVS